MSLPIVKSAIRVIEVLEFFAHVRRSATAAEIVGELDIPPSSASILLRNLVAIGYLEYLPNTRLYRTTTRVALLGEWMLEDHPNSLTARFNSLQCDNQEMAATALRVGSELQIIKIQPRDFIDIDPKPRRPLINCASGRALLSTMPPNTARGIIRRYNASANLPRHVNEEALLQSLKGIRDTGISETDPVLDGTGDFHGIVTLLTMGSGSAPVTLGILGPKERMLRKRTDIIQTLQRAAAP